MDCCKRKSPLLPVSQETKPSIFATCCNQVYLYGSQLPRDVRLIIGAGTGMLISGYIVCKTMSAIENTIIGENIFNLSKDPSFAVLTSLLLRTTTTAIGTITGLHLTDRFFDHKKEH